MSVLVSVCDVSLFLPGDPRRKNVLRRIDWRIEQGQHCALLGPNGSGKSTLLRLLAGELWPEKGKILWHGPQGAEDSPLAGRAMTSLISPVQQENCQRQAWDFAGRDLLLTGAAVRRERTDRRPNAIMSVEIVTIAKAVIG